LQLHTCNLDDEIWKIDGNESNLCDRFCRTINRVLQQYNFAENFDILLKYFAGSDSEIPLSGYQIVNNIILGATGIAPRRNDRLTPHIIENRYFQSWETHNVPGEDNIHDNARMNVEVNSSLKLLTQTFCDLIVNDSDYADLISKIIDKHEITKTTSSLNQLTHKDLSGAPDPNISGPIMHNLPVATPKESYVSSLHQSSLPQSSLSQSSLPQALLPPNVDEETNYIRDTIEDIMLGFTSSKIPVVHIAELTEMYNRLAVKLKQTTINPSQGNPRHRSIGLMAQSTSLGFYPDNIDIKLKCGQTVILPTKYENFDTFSDDELIQFHRYIKSCQSVDGRFNYMIEQVIKELAIRAS